MHHVFSCIREESFGIASKSSREIPVHSSLKCVSRSQSFPDTSDNYEPLLVSQSVNSVAPVGTLRASSPRLRSSAQDSRSRQMGRQPEKDTREGGDDADGAKRRVLNGGDDDEDEDELCARTGICRIRKGFNIQRKVSTKAERFSTTPFEVEESQLNGGDDVLVDETKQDENPRPMTPSRSNSGKIVEAATWEASENLAPTAAEKATVESNSQPVKRFQSKISPSLASETNTKATKRSICCVVQ